MQCFNLTSRTDTVAHHEYCKVQCRKRSLAERTLSSFHSGKYLALFILATIHPTLFTHPHRFAHQANRELLCVFHILWIFSYLGLCWVLYTKDQRRRPRSVKTPRSPKSSVLNGHTPPPPTQAWYFMEATEALLASMPPYHCLGALAMLQQKFTISS